MRINLHDNRIKYAENIKIVVATNTGHDNRQHNPKIDIVIEYENGLREKLIVKTITFTRKIDERSIRVS